MPEKIGTALGTWLYKNKVINVNEVYTVRFSIEILLSEFSTFFTIIMISIITNTILETIIYMISFQVLRNAFRGYHAKTILQCFFLTISVYMFIIILHPYVGSELLQLFLIGSLLETLYKAVKKNCKIVLILSSLL